MASGWSPVGVNSETSWNGKCQADVTKVGLPQAPGTAGGRPAVRIIAMMRPVPWTRRQLDYGRGVDELPVLIERVRGTTDRLRGLLQHRAPGSLGLRVSGRWSVLDHLGHLLALQDRFEERIADFEAMRPRLSPIDLQHQEVELDGHRLRRPGDMLEEFELKRKAFLRRVMALPAHCLEHASAHPCNGQPMRPMDMLLWIAEHDDHHLATMRALLDGVARERT